MRTLALDVGTKTIGVAVSDELGITANGVTTISRSDIKKDIEALKLIVSEYDPGEIVVGVPYRADGEVTKRGREIMRFADILKGALRTKIVYWDESYSTVNAENALIEADLGRKKRKKVIDKIAAVIILREYLSSK